MSGPILPPPTPPPISIMTIQPPNRYPLLEDRKITLVANKINEIVDNEELQRLFEVNICKIYSLIFCLGMWSFGII